MTWLDVVAVLAVAVFGFVCGLVNLVRGIIRAHQLRSARDLTDEDVQRARAWYRQRREALGKALEAEALPSDPPAWNHRFRNPYRRDTSPASYATIDEIVGARTVDEP